MATSQHPSQLLQSMPQSTHQADLFAFDCDDCLIQVVAIDTAPVSLAKPPSPSTTVSQTASQAKSLSKRTSQDNGE